jgi:3-hydroxyisobutyrate dehydrogenase
MIKVPGISKETKIGWIGTGVMGSSMFGHIVDAGYKGIVHTRTKSKARALLNSGVEWAGNPGEVALNSDILFTIVGFPSDVEEIYFGPSGILDAVKEGQVLVDMTTNSPSMAVRILNAAKKRGAFSLDAPVSGGDIGAKNATLSIMVGGDENVFNTALPLLEHMGDKITYQGKAGSGQHTKMSNQIMVASSMIGACESLLYGMKAGLDPEKMLASISKGAAACWTLDNLAPRILKRNFEPGFFVEHFVKDMGIVLDEAKRMNLVLPGLSLVHQLYISVQAKGMEKKGTQALMLALEELSNIKNEF